MSTKRTSNETTREQETTAGPWRVGGRSYDLMRADRNGFEDADTMAIVPIRSGRNDVAYVYLGCPGDANLIAAAPDLRDTLATFAREWKAGDVTLGTQMVAFALLARLGVEV